MCNIIVGQTEIIHNTEYKIADVGTFKLLKYDPVIKKDKNYFYLGTDIILYFEGDSKLGKFSDTITFVQAVTDGFHYVDGKGTHYTWEKNTDAGFKSRNPGVTGALPWNIDQCISSENKDFRYPEKRNTIVANMSTQDSKVAKLMTMSVAEINKLGVAEGAISEVAAEKQGYILNHLYDGTEPFPDIVYSAVNNGGAAYWTKARMSDSPRTSYPDNATSVEGEQHFKIFVLYESKIGNKKQVLCTIDWGWKVKEVTDAGKISYSAELLSCTATPGLYGNEFQEAAIKWNAGGVNVFQINEKCYMSV